jgi:hypothetical protein
MIKVLPSCYLTRDFPMYTFAIVTECIFTVFQSFQSSGYMYIVYLICFCLCVRKVPKLRYFYQQEKVNRFAKICYKILMPKKYAPVRVLVIDVADKIIFSKMLGGHRLKVFIIPC